MEPFDDFCRQLGIPVSEAELRDRGLSAIDWETLRQMPDGHTTSECVDPRSQQTPD